MDTAEKTALGFRLPRSPFERQHAELDEKLLRVRPATAMTRRPFKLTDDERLVIGRSGGPAIRWAQSYGITTIYVYDLRRKYKAGTL